MASTESSPLTCPYCGGYGVDRLYLGSLRLDMCECDACGARWDQDTRSGEFRGRASRSSGPVHRPHD